MLVIHRRLEEEAHIILPDGQKVMFKYLSRDGNQIKIGIEAPKDCKIVRSSERENDRLARLAKAVS